MIKGQFHFTISILNNSVGYLSRSKLTNIAHEEIRITITNLFNHLKVSLKISKLALIGKKK